jgi:hypothetical protein
MAIRHAQVRTTTSLLPSVHNVVVTLEKRRLIRRTPGAGRSIQLQLGRDQFPDFW